MNLVQMRHNMRSTHKTYYNSAYTIDHYHHRQLKTVLYEKFTSFHTSATTKLG